MRNTRQSRAQRGHKAHEDGQMAEALAALLLRLKGYRILGQRWRTPLGEIDLLAAKGDTLVLVEVKRRARAEDSAAAISAHQQQRLQAAAALAQSRYPHYAHIRCDAVLFAPLTLPRHIKGAF